jgi:DNA repair protein RAD50
MFSLDQKIKVLQREKDTINRNADERVKLGLKKDALESSKDKLNEMHVSFLSLFVLCIINFICMLLLSPSSYY